MLERAAGIVRRVDKDALHPSGIIREQSFQCFQVVSLYEHIGGFRVARTVLVVCLQQAIGHGFGGCRILVAVKPVQNRDEMFGSFWVASKLSFFLVIGQKK